MIKKTWLGNKSGEGSYKQTGAKQLLTLNPVRMIHEPCSEVSFGPLKMVRTVESLPERLKSLIALEDRLGRFFWRYFSAVLVYAARRIPEISDDIVSVDNALKWGFNWELGPFETWDALGVESVAQRILAEGGELPHIVQSVLATPYRRFYQSDHGSSSYFDPVSCSYKDLPTKRGIVDLCIQKQKGSLIKESDGACLIDLGEGVACVEFHSKMNNMGADALRMIREGIKLVEENDYGLVIGNQGSLFSSGVNLLWILHAAQNEEWEEISCMIQTFQNVNTAIKYAPGPVVVAPFGLTLGGDVNSACTPARIMRLLKLI